jgi:aryl carrier-like protein
MPDEDSTRVELNEVTIPMIANVRKELSKLLPSYMVPSVYIPIPLTKLPMTATGKTDRQRVRVLGKTYSLPAPSSPDASVSDPILINTEEALRGIWARLLDIKPDLIPMDHSFSEAGGDSIKIMSLAMAIRNSTSTLGYRDWSDSSIACANFPP